MQKRAKVALQYLMPILATLVLIVAAWASYCFAKAEKSVPILNYHQVNNSKEINSLIVTNTAFAKQMRYLAENGYHTITLDELADAREMGTELPDKPIVITFDDGYADNYEWAYPILKRHGFKATIFLVSDFVGRFPNYLTWDNVEEMQKSGLISFESHTLSHEDLTKLPATDMRHQLQGSREALAWHLKKPVHFLAYPCGAFNAEVIRNLEETGYKAAFTVNYGLASPDESPFMLDRIPIFGGLAHGMMHFRMRLELAPVLTPLSDWKTALQKGSFPFLAELIWLP